MRRMGKKTGRSSLELTPMVSGDSDDEDFRDIDGFLNEEEEEMDRMISSYGKNPKKVKKPKQATSSKVTFIRKAIGVASVAGFIYFMVTSIDFSSSNIVGWFRSAPQHDAFELIESKTVKEYNAALHVYRHRKTQAEFASLIFKDEEEANREDKVFGASFRTVPTNSNGVAHILEHSVLNGSHKYPVKDPFLHLKKSSLNTYLNAMTYNDRTVYPIASRNSADFQNLMKVYLDAVFYPLCVEEKGHWIIQQEGWRYEIVQDDDGDDHLEYTGVVYSEMKGAYSNPLRVLSEEATALLFPDNTYRFDSGGDPKEIPSLNFGEFVSFYRKHYHPSNAQIFVSGTNDDVKASMDLINAALKNFDQKNEARSKTAIPYQKKTYKNAKFKQLQFAATSKEKNKLDAEKGQGLVSLTWLLNDEEMDTYTDLAFTILEYLLIANDSSPLKKALELSNLGDSVIADGYQNYLLQATFGVGLKDVSSTAQRDFSKVVINTLQDLFDNGFDDGDIAAAVNILEFKLRETDTGSMPKAMELFLAILTKWNYDQDPYLALEYEKPFKQLKKDIKKEGSSIFQNLIKKYLLDNRHRVVLELLPSETFEEEQLKEEKERLSELKESFSEDEFQKIVHDNEVLKNLQNSPDLPRDIKSIPKLSIQDIPTDVEKYPIDITENAFSTGITMLKHEIPSSQGIVYVQYGIDVSNVKYEDIEFLPLICNLMEKGTKEMNESDFHRAVDTKTGGISVYLSFEPVVPLKYDASFVTSGNNFKTYLIVDGKSTVDNAREMLNLFSKILNDADFDKKKMIEILFNEELSLLKTSVPSRGHAYSNMRIMSRYNPLSFINENLHGVASFEKLERQKELLDKNWDSFLKRLEEIMKTILSTSPEGLILNLTGDKKGLKSIENHAEAFLKDQLQISDTNRLSVLNYREVDHPWAEKARTHMDDVLKNEAIIVSTQVSYIGEGGLMYKDGEKISGSAQVVKGYLDNGYLWETIRVKNGAYGAFTTLSISTGLFVFLTYRDPNFGVTLKAFDGASSILLDLSKTGDLSQGEMTTAIIGAIGSLERSALTPREIGWLSFQEYLTGRGYEFRKRWRNEILMTQKTDFTGFGSRLKTWNRNSFTAIASELSVSEFKNSTNIQFETINLT